MEIVGTSLRNYESFSQNEKVEPGSGDSEEHFYGPIQKVPEIFEESRAGSLIMMEGGELF